MVSFLSDGDTNWYFRWHRSTFPVVFLLQIREISIETRAKHDTTRRWIALAIYFDGMLLIAGSSRRSRSWCPFFNILSIFCHTMFSTSNILFDNFPLISLFFQEVFAKNNDGRLMDRSSPGSSLAALRSLQR